jgi:hypothetical protein
MQNTTQASSKSSKAQGGIFEHSGADSLWKMVRSYEIGVKHSATFHQRAGAVLVLEEGIISGKLCDLVVLLYRTTKMMG